MAKVSVVVPIYRVEEYIESCLESLVNQTLDDIEIIMINDGSPDNSPFIAEGFAKKHENFKLYNKKNGGLADARNFAMQFVQGEYVTFLDSDDRFTPKACEVLYKAAKEKQSDIVIGKPVWKYDDGTEEAVGYLDKWFKKDLSQNFRDDYRIALGFPVGTSKLFRTDMIVNNNLKFPNIIGEDIVFSVYSFYHSERIDIIKDKIYLRTERKEENNKSITQTFNYKTVDDRLFGLSKILEFCEEKELEELKYDSFNVMRYIIKVFNNMELEADREKAFYRLKDFLYTSIRSDEHSIIKSLFGMEYYEILESEYSEFKAKVLKAVIQNEKIDEDSRVSVIIPTYNRPVKLRATILSALDQSYQNLEVIVVDDNNPDTEARAETEKLMEEFKENTKVRYIKHSKNKNGAAARNTGIKHADGKYIAFLDDDDTFHCEKIEKQIMKLIEYKKKDESYRACYCGVIWSKNGKEIRKSNEEIIEGNLQKEILLLDRNIIISSSLLLMEKEVLMEINGFDEGFKRHQDYEMLIRFFNKYKVCFLKERLVESQKDDRQNLPNSELLLAVKTKYLNKFKVEIDRFGKYISERIIENNLEEVLIYMIREGKKEEVVDMLAKFSSEWTVSDGFIAKCIERQDTGRVNHNNFNKNNEIEYLKYKIEELNREINVIRKSNSWIVTKPLRQIGRIIRKLRK